MAHLVQGSESKKYQDTNAAPSTMSWTECLASAAVHACNPKENNNINTTWHQNNWPCRSETGNEKGLSVFVSVFVHFRKTLGGPNIILSECTDRSNSNDRGSTLMSHSKQGIAARLLRNSSTSTKKWLKIGSKHIALGYNKNVPKFVVPK